jgi:serine/threonine-protein kinase RsbW
MLKQDDNTRLIRHAHLQVKTDLNEIAQVLQWFEQFKQPPLPDRFWLQGQIALIEGFTNAVRHAHQNLPQQTPIDLSVNVFAHRLEISIWDEGAAFDLQALLNQVEQRFSDPLKHEAHWGGVLMRKLKDQHGWKIHYYCPGDQAGDRNCLLMQKEFT